MILGSAGITFKQRDFLSRRSKLGEVTNMETPEPDTLPGTSENVLEKLEDQLDELWVTYLGLLDEYTRAQRQIQKAMSSGYLSLARAQSNAPFGRRYGQDWYDERMKATQRTAVSTSSDQQGIDAMESSLQNLKISITSPMDPESSKEGPTGGSSSESEEAEPAEPTQQPSPPGTPEPEGSQKEAENDQTDPFDKASSTDPLKWYGILVPAELRKAQASFTTLTGGLGTSHAADNSHSNHAPVANAVNAARGLRSVEAEIRQLRKAVRKAEKVKATAN